MKRRRLALGIVVAALVPLAGAAWAVEATPAWNHDPGSAIGPTHWGTLTDDFKQCVEGTSQSPVDIARTAHGGGPALQFRYPDNELVVENTGHVIEVPLPEGNHNTLKVGNSVYTLVQYHFHAPSEHTLNGKHYDLEVHLVHQNAAGETAVVGVLMNIGLHPNELVEQVFHNAPDVAGEETDVGVESNARELLPVARWWHHGHGTRVITRYYTYSGSLTTPPCSEGVRWFLAKDPVYVSAFAVEKMHDLVAQFPNYDGHPDNNRPVQPLNGRVVTSRP